MAPGEKGSKRPRISVWAYDVRKKGRIFGSGSRGNWKAKKTASKKVDGKKGSLFALICLLLFFVVVQCVPMTLSLVHRVCSFRECIFVDDDSPHFWHQHPSH